MTIPYDLPDVPGAKNVFPRSGAAERMDTLRLFLRYAEEAMEAESVGEGTRQRVINRLVWGEPEGYVAVRRVADPDETMELGDVAPNVLRLAEEMLKPYGRS